MAAFWPHQTDDNPIAYHLNATPKHVVTRTPTALEWAGSEPLYGDLSPAVAELKDRGEGHITILGSGVLVHQLMHLNLIDELRLFIHPRLLGTGKRLFRSLPGPRALCLVDVGTTPLGTVTLSYARHN